MKKFLLTVFLFMLSINVFAQYPEVTIMDIQYQDPALLITYFEDDMPSPLNGDTVTVTGMVMVSPYVDHDPANGTIMYFGTIAGFYMQDTSETEWAGLLVLQEPPISPFFEILDSGTVVKVTGVVTEYDDGDQKSTELFVLDFDASNIIGFQDKPEPIELTLDSLKETGSNISKAISEKWEGSYVVFRGVTVFEPTANGGFRVLDDNNTQLNIYTRSSYYYGSTPPAVNTKIDIRGFVETRSEAVGGVSINPAYPGDVTILSQPPSVSDVTRNIVEVHSGDAVTISSNIIDNDGIVTEAKLFYRENMGSVHNELTMNNTSGNEWQTIIPGYNDSTLIDFFIRAVDDSNYVTLTPVDTSSNRYFYMVLDRALTIQDVQYSPFGSGFSGYNSFEVTVRGIVTADTTDLEGDGNLTGPKVFIQNGTGTWSGLSIAGTETLLKRRGDDLSVTGTVIESFGVTQISGIDDPANVTTHSQGNPLPDPELILTATIGQLSDGSVDAEQWEGVLSKYEDIVVFDENADGDPGPVGAGSNFGEMLVKDASDEVTRVELQDGTHQYHNFWDEALEGVPIRIQDGNRFEELIGILWYSFSNYKLVPRKDDDFVGHSTNVGNESMLPTVYELSQNYPNPFNPSTKIQFALPVGGNVTLKVFNLLGQEVKTLLNNQVKPAGRHEVIFNASSLPSGIYFYRMQTDSFVQVKKMMLLK